jgi:hypothetical protein
MAKSRRKAGGCNNVVYKRKKMGKGWATIRQQPQQPRPVVRLTKPTDAGSDSDSD